MNVKSTVDYSGNSIGKNRARFWAYGQIPIETLLKKKHVVIASRECGDIAFLVSLGVSPANIIACDIDAIALDEAAKLGVIVSPYHDIESTISNFVDPSELGTVNVDLCQTLASLSILTHVLKRVECTVFYTFFRARDSFHSTEERIQHLQANISLAGCKTAEKCHLDYQSKNEENNGSPMCCVVFLSREEWYGLAYKDQISRLEASLASRNAKKQETARIQVRAARACHSCGATVFTSNETGLVYCSDRCKPSYGSHLERQIEELAKIVEEQKKTIKDSECSLSKWREEVSAQVLSISQKPKPIVNAWAPRGRVYVAPDRPDSSTAGMSICAKYMAKEQGVIEYCQGKREVYMAEILSTVFEAKSGDFGMARNIAFTLASLGFERKVASVGKIVYRRRETLSPISPPSG